jgi:hypothetical protein
MIDISRNAVGRNCILELDLSLDRSGLIPAEYAARYKQLGDFIRSCYCSPVAHGSTHINADVGIYFMSFECPTPIDRIVVMDDQTNGQVIREYEVNAKIMDATGGNGTLNVPFTIVSNGTSVGHKKIDLFAKAMTVTEVVVKATRFADVPVWRSVEAYLCDRFDNQR